MSDPFVNASTINTDGVKIASFKDHLVLFEVTEHKQNFPTENGEKDPVVADITVFGDGDKVEEHSGILIFQGRLIGKLKGHVNGMPYLGYLTRDEKGRNQPWDLLPANKEQKARARAYLEQRDAGSDDPFAS